MPEKQWVLGTADEFSCGHAELDGTDRQEQLKHLAWKRLPKRRGQRTEPGAGVKTAVKGWAEEQDAQKHRTLQKNRAEQSREEKARRSGTGQTKDGEYLMRKGDKQQSRGSRLAQWIRAWS